MHKYSLRMGGVLISCMVVVIMIGDYNKAVGCLVDEKIALLKLKDAINHDEEVEDCCKWEGVTCDPISKRIISLNLNPSDIIKNISLDASLLQPFEELQKFIFSCGGMEGGLKGPLRLPKLQVLDLKECGLISVGELPSLKFLYLTGTSVLDDYKALTNLSSLELLNLLEVNDIDGRISPSILGLTSLKMLGLLYNQLNGSLPEELCTLTSLEELDLSHNFFEGVIPVCLSNLTSLRVLDLSGNQFSGSIPSTVFSSLKSLEYISLSFNPFVGPIPFSSLANNSNLLVFELQLDDDDPKIKVDTVIPQLKFPLFQLKVFILSNCILNEPTGGIPRFLLSQYDLRIVDLDDNGMTGELPSWLISNNSKLESLGLRNNHFTGQLLLQPDTYRADMGWLDVSKNQLTGEIPTFIGSVLPNLFHLDMSTNSIKGSFPYSIENMRKLEALDLSDNHLFGELYGGLFNGCNELNILKLSNNNLGANLTNFLPNILQLPKLEILFLNGNNFYGEILLPTLRLPRGCPLYSLDISYNLISGRFPDWIAEFTHLYTLVLSNNQFEGELPTSFCNLSTKLTNLDLSWNNFGDFFPLCSNLPSLTTLHLQGNVFHGPLPTSFKRSPIIWTMDVRYNKFSGLIPSWIGSLSSLSNLLLKGNHFHGSLPAADLCQLKGLTVIDLSANNLSGPVPFCLFNISFDHDVPESWLTDAVVRANFGPAPKYSYKRNLQVSQSSFSILYWVYDVKTEMQFTTKNRSETYKGNAIQDVYGIDLSLNKFTGPIPMDFGKLEYLYSLNLSNNQLNGSIPWTLSGLTNLQSLDLSHNMLSDKIPSEITKLTSLEVFSVAYNNLSGSTPTTNQFETFDSSSYEGNPLLCGFQLNISCSPRSTTPQHAKPSGEPEQNDTSFKTNFLWSFFGSFVVSCIGSFVFFYFGSKVPQIILGWLGIKERVHRQRIIELPWMWNK